jgi:hypothetical protein
MINYNFNTVSNSLGAPEIVEILVNVVLILGGALFWFNLISKIEPNSGSRQGTPQATRRRPEL